MNRWRPRASRPRFDLAVVAVALCVAACMGQGPGQGDGGDAAKVSAPDSAPYDSTADRTGPVDDSATAETAPEGSLDTGSSSSSSSSGGNSSGSDSSTDSARTDSPSEGDSATTDASADATVEAGAEASVEAGTDGNSCVRGKTPPNQVVMLGDSYLDPLFSPGALDIFADAQKAGSLATNMTYRHYYQGGATMLGGAGLLSIPFQWMQATMDPAVQDPSTVDTVIMTGGGTDFLLGDRSCLLAPPTFSDGGVANPSCNTTIQSVMNQLTNLMQNMAGKGVKHIIYFFYPHLDPNGGGLLTMPAPAVNQTIDYAALLAENACETVAQCLFVDLRPAFEGKVAQYISVDQVNPSIAGAQVLADLVWRVMVDHCIAQ